MIDISPLKSLTDHKFFNLIAEKAINESVTLVQSNYLMILVTLNSNNISQFAVQQLSMKGVLGDNNNLRSITWKYLLGYIGNNINNWEDECISIKLFSVAKKIAYVKKPLYHS